MLERRAILARLGESGDTLIEVTFALAILSFVLLGSTAVAAAAFRTGQTARERTQISEAAQGQMEALRSFRDNSSSWAVFRAGIDSALTGSCTTAANLAVSGTKCFHMENQTIGASTVWVPVAGTLPAAQNTSNVPGAAIEITSYTPGALRNCGYDFQLQYAFTPLGGGTAANNIATRLVNLKYSPNGSPQCPPS